MSHFSTHHLFRLFSPLWIGVAAAFAPFPSALADELPAPAPVVSLPDFTGLIDKVGPAVVNIRTTGRIPFNNSAIELPPGMDNSEMLDFLQRFFGFSLPQQRPAPRSEQTPEDESAPDAGMERSNGVGSGFVISADGYVMTNTHVVYDADSIYVSLPDKREFKAKLIGADKRTDVALLKIEAKNLLVVTLGDSSKLRVGEWVVAIGSPFGFENTLTAGIVSAKGRNTGDYLPFIQTDVAVNPGNSGGPLLNLRGEVVGINSQIYSRTGGFMGISFAIPIDEATRVAEQLKATGKVARGRIAVAIGQVTKEVANSLGLPRAQGAFVSSVEANGPADKAGVQAGDIILNFNGKTIEEASDLPRLVGATKPGARVTITVWRKGKKQDLVVSVAEMQPDRPARALLSQANPRMHTENSIGLTVSNLSEAQLKALKLRYGVRVEAAQGPAAQVGIRRGDIVLRIGATDIQNAQQLDTVVRTLDPKKMVAILVRRGENTQFVPLRPRVK